MAFAFAHLCLETILARIFHEWLAATTDTAVLPGVLGPRTLRRTAQVRLGFEPLRLPGGTLIFTVSLRRIMKYPGNSIPGLQSEILQSEILKWSQQAIH